MKRIVSIFIIISAIFVTSCDSTNQNKDKMKRRDRTCPCPKKQCNSCTSSNEAEESLEKESVSVNEETKIDSENKSE
ncbi:MAG: hypothetical protein K1060chlam5_00692 [Candidatus Anoxychlamydiales bacterium]|nr:hypothetical protein [Candidatus Anoxychlamydiales bacterium]